MIEKSIWFPFTSTLFGERIGRLVKGSGRLEIMVLESRRCCWESVLKNIKIVCLRYNNNYRSRQNPWVAKSGQANNFDKIISFCLGYEIQPRL